MSGQAGGDEERPVKPAAVRGAAASAVGAVAASLAGRVDPTLQATVAALVPTLPILAAELDRRSGYSVARMLTHLLGPGEPLDGVGRLQRLLEDPEAALLLRRAALAAAGTASEDKLRLLGLSLQHLADEPARFDDEQLVVAAVADLEASHLQLLQLLSDDAARVAHAPAQQPLTSSEPPWDPAGLAQYSRGRFTAAQVRALLQPLTLRACVQTVSLYGGVDGYLLAPLGRVLLERAALAAGADPAKGDG